jgi:hypothetical protein
MICRSIPLQLTLSECTVVPKEIYIKPKRSLKTLSFGFWSNSSFILIGNAIKFPLRGV